MTVQVTDFETSLEVQDNFDHVIGMLDLEKREELAPQLSKIPNRTMFWFDDTTRTDGFFKSNPPTQRDIGHMIAIFKRKKLDEEWQNVLIHCQAGISRSTACAIGLLIMRGKTIQQAFKIIHLQREAMWPNELILRHFDDLLKLDGELVEHDRQWKAKHRFAFKIHEDFED